MTDDGNNEKIHEFRKLILKIQLKIIFQRFLTGIPNLTHPSIYHTPNPVSLSVDFGKKINIYKLLNNLIFYFQQTYNRILCECHLQKPQERKHSN